MQILLVSIQTMREKVQGWNLDLILFWNNLTKENSKLSLSNKQFNHAKVLYCLLCFVKQVLNSKSDSSFINHYLKHATLILKQPVYCKGTFLIFIILLYLRLSLQQFLLCNENN